ncbi:MAG: prolipoprotein diacylglyceryl transferase [Candidatus Cyclobacteriaceae bacterium M3_2C_046]
MHPNLFSIHIPEFLRNLFSFLPEHLTIHAYGSLIGLGVLMSLWYATHQASKMQIAKTNILDLFIWVFIAAYIGGRVLHFFEKPEVYFTEPSKMLTLSGSGFVFYGSLLFAIPTMLIFFRIYKLPTLKMIDLMAFVAVIVHFFGRMGCFMAGCCHGLPSQSFLAVTFTDPASKAEPLHTALHPTQLYSGFMLLLIFAVLSIIKNRQQFDGQLFISYVIIYAFGRSLIEEFRGDEIRGFVLDGLLSHSQFISLIVGLGAMYIYYRLWKRSNLLKAKTAKSKA